MFSTYESMSWKTVLVKNQRHPDSSSEHYLDQILSPFDLTNNTHFSNRKRPLVDQVITKMSDRIQVHVNMCMSYHATEKSHGKHLFHNQGIRSNQAKVSVANPEST